MEDAKFIRAFSIVLKKLRIERRISQEELAEQAQLHPTYISMLETQKRQPSLSTLFRISQALNVNTDEFVRQITLELTSD